MSCTQSRKFISNVHLQRNDPKITLHFLIYIDIIIFLFEDRHFISHFPFFFARQLLFFLVFNFLNDNLVNHVWCLCQFIWTSKCFLEHIKTVKQVKNQRKKMSARSSFSIDHLFVGIQKWRCFFYLMFERFFRWKFEWRSAYFILLLEFS